MKAIARMLGVTLLLGAVATTAFAGGPNYVFDNENEVPYRWNLESWPGGAVPVYTDLGGLGLMNNAQATDWVVRAWDQWNNLPTSAFRAQVVGNVSLLGLGDITPANVSQVFPSRFNGGGITVVYDYDGKIFRDYLGLGQSSILGIAYMEFASPDGEILEATIFINGFMQWFNDTDGAGMSGVFTHEFGHAANLSHSQASGAVFNDKVLDYPWPYGCSSGPYAGAKGSGPTKEQIETMYPFLDNRITGTSKYQFSVDKLDDIAAISDLYPEAGWPEDYGTIQGTIKSLTKILGNGTGPEKQVTGVNVIARNVADPYNDFTSAVSGGLTRGFAGEDGTFEMHGLTPGAQYVIYVDNLAAGAFPYPRMLALPGPEEWYNADLESGNGETDDRCAWTPITVAAQTTQTADITFNRVKGAPAITYMNFNGSVQSISADGSVMSGNASNMSSYWLWSEANGYQVIGGFAPTGGRGTLTADGSKFAGNYKDTDGIVKWGIRDNATGAWQILPTPTGGTCLTSTNGFGNQIAMGTVFGISGDGSTVVGNSYNNGANSCRRALATKWNATDGAQTLEKYPNPTTNPESRANAVNYDGSVIVGYDLSPGRNGVYWKNGVEHFMGSPTQSPFVGEASDVSGDGVVSVGTAGNNPGGNPLSPKGAYKFYTTNDSYETVGVAEVNGSATGYKTNDAGTVISGFSRLGQATNAKIWTSGIGWSDFTQVLNSQGIYAPEMVFFWPNGVSSNGTVLAGTAATVQGSVPYRIEIPKAIVCHKSPGGRNTATHNLDVTFPGGLDEHLAHGDTLGLCEHGGD